MLRKLMKHEFRATGRVMLPMYLVLLVTAVGSNLADRSILDSRYEVLNVLGMLVITAFGFSICGVLLISFVLMIQRFYKNLIQDVGYLMFTLPVNVHQHIWAKLIVSSVWFTVTVLAVILSGLVVVYDMGFLRELFDFLGYFFQGLQKLKISEALNGTVYLAEFAVLIFLSLNAFSLQFYAALATGHSFANHKMLLSVVFFFGFQFAIQFLGSTLFITLDHLDLIPYFRWDLTPQAAIHLGLLLAIGGVILYGMIFYAITTFFLKKRLNLE